MVERNIDPVSEITQRLIRDCANKIEKEILANLFLPNTAEKLAEFFQGYYGADVDLEPGILAILQGRSLSEATIETTKRDKEIQKERLQKDIFIKDECLTASTKWIRLGQLVESNKLDEAYSHLKDIFKDFELLGLDSEGAKYKALKHLYHYLVDKHFITFKFFNFMNQFDLVKYFYEIYKGE